MTAEGKSGLTSTEDILKNLTTDALTIRIMQGSESKGIFTLDSQKVKLQVAGLAKQAEAYSQSSSSKSSTGTTSTCSLCFWTGWTVGVLLRKRRLQYQPCRFLSGRGTSFTDKN